MSKTSPVANKEMEEEGPGPGPGPKGKGAPKTADTKPTVDRQTETNGLSSPWTVHSKAQVIGCNENTASRLSKIAAAEETANKKVNGWSVSEVRSKPASQYGAYVEAWTGGGSVADEVSGAAKARKKRQQRPDFYDAEYDRGRIKKVKKNKHDQFALTINPYQMYSEYNFKKRRS
ncbi:hypothetical protein LPJ59_006021 [Coemansia sp. RSA 2399]|nr:hypothetical protein LPJ59_006021 [Coemansia sp. RSA 2399]KAJ1890340.1 hypothetical protein LPJ81_005952 [Coemansia sp. IMI 209127]